MLDFEKVGRQLEAALRAANNPKRKELIEDMVLVYAHIRKNKLELAKEALGRFNLIAVGLGWKSVSGELPRPFNHKHLERLYWEARTLLTKELQPRRGEGADRKFDDYSDLHLRSKISKPMPRVRTPWNRRDGGP